MASNNPSLPPQKLPLKPSFGLSPLAIPPPASAAAMMKPKPRRSWIGPSFSSDNEECNASEKETEAVIANDPVSAAALYRAKQLWTDFDVAGTTVRVAFRYILQDETSSKANTNQKQDNKVEVEQKTGDEQSANPSQHDDNTTSVKEEMHLCWINSSGTPHHFYSLSPLLDNQSEVNSDDHIETTFPGHGFVYCKKLNDQMTRMLMDKVRSGQHEGEVEKKDEIYVVNDESGVVFLRRKDAEESESEDESSSESDEEGESSDDSSTDDEVSQVSEVSRWSFTSNEKKGADNHSDDENADNDQARLDESVHETILPSNFDGEWEAFLIVGGFRLGNVAFRSETASDDDKKDVADKRESDESSISSSDDEDEWSMQLVAMVQKRMAGASSKKDNVVEPSSSLRGAKNNINKTNGDIYKAFYHQNQFILTAQLRQLDSTPISSVDKHYDSKTVGGWPCKVEPGSLSNRQLRKRIIADINAACTYLPPHACQKLQQSTPIWINKSLAYGPKVAPIREANMCFHGGSGWLKRNGMNPAKKGGIEMYKSSAYLDDCFLWGVGGLMLHELSHAWHRLHCDDGFDNVDIQECYDKAMEEKLYDCVPFHCRRGKKDRRKAYACTNAMEYFAELSAAFLGGLDEKEYNKWYPFNRKQIREHDPRAFDMLCKMWGVSEVEYGKV